MERNCEPMYKNRIEGAAPNSVASYFAAEHGPSACGMAFRVQKAPKAFARALEKGAQALEQAWR